MLSILTMSDIPSRSESNHLPPPSPPRSTGQIYSQPPPVSADPLYQPKQQARAPFQPSSDYPNHSRMQETDDGLTEEERIEYEKGIIGWDKVKDWRFWIRREWLWWYVVAVIIIVIVALMAFFHHSVSSQ